MQKKFWLAASLALFIMPFNAWAEDVAQADVRVDFVKVTSLNDTLTCKVRVSNTHDDDSYDTQVVILLPVNVQVTSVTTGCTIGTPYGMGASDTQSHGIVTCSLGQMGVNTNKSVSVTVKKLPNNINKRFGAFAWSTTPDPNPVNNHKVSVP